MKRASRASILRISPWGALAVMTAFSMHSLWIDFKSAGRVQQGPQATTLDMMARVLGSRDAAVDLNNSLQLLPPAKAVVTVVNEQNDDLLLLQYLVRYVAWPRQFGLIDCADPRTSLAVPANSAVVLTDSGRASVAGDVHRITGKVALVEVARAEAVACH